MQYHKPHPGRTSKHGSTKPLCAVSPLPALFFAVMLCLAALWRYSSIHSGVGAPEALEKAVRTQPAGVRSAATITAAGTTILKINSSRPAAAAAATVVSQKPAALPATGSFSKGSSTSAADNGKCAESGSIALLKRWAVNNTVLLAYSDWSLTPHFFPHWHGNIKASGLNYWLVVAKDDATTHYFEELGLGSRCYQFHPEGNKTVAGSGHKHEEYAWSGVKFNVATWLKVHLAYQALQWGFDVLVSDLDVVWFRDPMPFFQRFPEPDMLMSLDTNGDEHGVGDTGLSTKNHPYMLHNTGVYLARSNPRTLAAFDRWLQIGEQHHDWHDQHGFNQWLQGEGRERRQQHIAERRVTVYTAINLTVGALPLPSFLNSYTLGVANLPQLKQLPPYEVHLVWGYGQREGKLYRLRDLGLAFDPLEYYSQGRYISFDLRPPEVPDGYNDWGKKGGPWEKKSGVDMDLVHQAALDMQLQQLYHAMGIAIATNRTLVMPRMLCFCVMNWYFVERCRLDADSDTVLPFRCTGDHVFDMMRMANPPPVNGTLLTVRPPYFLEDPRTFDLRSKAVLVNPGQPTCTSSSSSPPAANVSIPANGTTSTPSPTPPPPPAAAADQLCVQQIQGANSSALEGLLYKPASGGPAEANTSTVGPAAMQPGAYVTRARIWREGVVATARRAWRYARRLLSMHRSSGGLQRPRQGQQQQQTAYVAGAGTVPTQMQLASAASAVVPAASQHTVLSTSSSSSSSSRKPVSSRLLLSTEQQQEPVSLVVPTGLTGEQITQLLEPHKDLPWLHFSNVTSVFTGFASPASQQQFKEMLAALMQPWCCRKEEDAVQLMLGARRHWHVIRPWGSKQKLCAKEIPNMGEHVLTVYCDAT